MDLISEQSLWRFGYSEKAYHIALGRLIINSNSLKIDCGHPDVDKNVRETHLMQETAGRTTGKSWGGDEAQVEEPCEAKGSITGHLLQSLRDA